MRCTAPFAACAGDQRLARLCRVELESIEQTTILEVPKLDLETNSRIEHTRPVSLCRLAIDDLQEHRELDVTMEDRGVADDRQYLLYGLPLRLSRGREVTDSHEDE